MELIIDTIAHNIVDDVTITLSLKLSSDELNIEPNVSPLINFRDALNHYRRAYENQKNDEIFISESSAIKEHLVRGLRDALNNA